LLISFFILVPVIKVHKLYKYESKDNRVWKGFISREGELKEDKKTFKTTEELFGKLNSREGELKDEESKYYRIDTEGRKYYYVGSYDEYSLDEGNSRHPTYADERIVIVIIINGLLLIYTLRTKKPSKTSDNTV